VWSIRPLPEFTTWLNEFPDAGVRGVLVARLKRLELGLTGDVRSVGAGWRIYFVRRGERVIVLLAGGSKRSQEGDIRRARALATSLE
jgi:putative addiction module killer protein